MVVFASSIAQSSDFGAERKICSNQKQLSTKGGDTVASFFDLKNSHPLANGTKLADFLVEKGYLYQCITSGDDDDSFSMDKDLPKELFFKAADAFGFSRDRTDSLRLLAKKNIEAVVLNGSPFLFKNGENLSRKMKLYLSGEGSNELEREKAQTVDACDTS